MAWRGTRGAETEERSEAVAEGRKERARVRRPLPGGAVHPHHVEVVVGVGDHVPEAGGADQPTLERRIQRPGAGQPVEGIGIACRGAQPQVKARRQGEIDDDLHGLPEMEDDRVRCVGARPKTGGIDKAGRVIGFELLHYRPASTGPGLAAETVVHGAP